MIAELAAGADEVSPDLENQFELLDIQIQTFPDKDYGYQVNTMEVVETLTTNQMGDEPMDVSDFLKALKLMRQVHTTLQKEDIENEEIDLCQGLSALSPDDIIPVIKLRILCRAINIDNWVAKVEGQYSTDEHRLQCCEDTMFAKLIFHLKSEPQSERLEIRDL